MPSLAEAYDRQAGEVSRERLYLGTGLFGLGALLAVAGIVLGTTGVLPSMGFSKGQTFELAGTLAGLGVPAVFVGIFAVLPAGRAQRATAAIGASLAVLGVMLFRHAYWEHWYDATGTPTALTLLVAAVYFLGTITTFWSMFTAVATFKRRNDPGGTVELTISQGGRTRTVEVAESSLEEAKAALGSVGVFGGVDDPEREAEHHVEVTGDRDPTAGAQSTTASDGPTAAADDATVLDDRDGGSSDGWRTGDRDGGSSDGWRTGDRDGGRGRTDAGGLGGATPTSDGGATESEIRSPMDDDGEVLTDSSPAPPTDRYCGNCSHFEYVRTSDGMQPYCGHHDAVMDDMEACDAWAPNR